MPDPPLAPRKPAQVHRIASADKPIRLSLSLHYLSLNLHQIRVGLFHDSVENLLNAC